MKNLMIPVSLFICASAIAACPEANYEGVYANSSNHFRIVQPNCDRMILTDVENNITNTIDFNNVPNPIDLGVLRTVPAELNRITPFSVYAAWGERAYGMPMEPIKIYLQTKVQIRARDRQEGIAPPTMRMTFNLVPFRYSGSKKLDGLAIYYESIGAVVDRNASPIQRAFARGINFACDLLMRLALPSNITNSYDYLHRTE